MTVDNLIDGLVMKLGDAVSPRWAHTFTGEPRAYKRMQKLLSTYGEPVVRGCLQYALEARIVPKMPNAMPLMVSLCKQADLPCDHTAGLPCPRHEVDDGRD